MTGTEIVLVLCLAVIVLGGGIKISVGDITIGKNNGRKDKSKK